MSEPRSRTPSDAPTSDGADHEPATPANGSGPDADDVVADLELQLRRALADLDNLRKRFDREVGRQCGQVRADVAREWLPVVDNLERSLPFGSAEESAFTAGVRAVLDQALSILARLGYPRFDDVGVPFDPARHEAVGTVPSDAPPGSVVGVVRAGYGGDGSILRPAGVIVSAGSPDG